MAVRFRLRRWRGLLFIMFGLLTMSGCSQLPEEAVQKIQRANSYYASGQYSDAQRLLNLVISNHRDTKGVGEAYYIRGLCHLHTKSESQAIADFERAIATSDRRDLWARTHAQLGHMNYYREDFRSAAQYYARALEDYPNQSPKDEIYYRYADSLQKIGQWKEAADVWGKVWQLFPNSEYGNYARRKFAWGNQHPYFTVQCGAYQRSELAKQKAAELRGSKLDAAIEVDTRNAATMHVVYVGHYSNYAEAVQNLRRIQANVPEAFIVP